MTSNNCNIPLWAIVIYVVEDCSYWKFFVINSSV